MQKQSKRKSKLFTKQMTRLRQIQSNLQKNQIQKTKTNCVKIVAVQKLNK